MEEKKNRNKTLLLLLSPMLHIFQIEGFLLKVQVLVQDTILDFLVLEIITSKLCYSVCYSHDFRNLSSQVHFCLRCKQFLSKTSKGKANKPSLTHCIFKTLGAVFFHPSAQEQRDGNSLEETAEKHLACALQ